MNLLNLGQCVHGGGGGGGVHSERCRLDAFRANFYRELLKEHFQYVLVRIVHLLSF